MNKYTVDLKEGQAIVTVNKSGKQYPADMGAELQSIMDTVNSLKVEVVDVTAKYQASVDWFKENVRKNKTTGELVMLDHKSPQVAPNASKTVAPSTQNTYVPKGQINYNTVTLDVSKISANSLLLSCGNKGIDPFSGREVTDRVIDYLNRHQDEMPAVVKGICLDYENQQNIKAGRPLVTIKEVANRRRKGIFAAQNKAQAEANKSVVQPVEDNKPLF